MRAAHKALGCGLLTITMAALAAPGRGQNAADKVTLQAMSPGGTVVANRTLTLNPGQVVTRLTTEFFGGGLPAQLVVRVTASAPIVTASITGSYVLDALRSLPVLR